MSRTLLSSLLLTVFLFVPARSGEIVGTVDLNQNKVPARAKNSNPNRKDTLKKYGNKVLAQAQAGGLGGLPESEKVDERDYVVLFLTQEKDGKSLPATPKSAEVEQRERRFWGHVTPIVLGSKVVFTNKDKFFHHIYCPDSSSLNVPEHRGDVSRKPDRLGKYELFCDIHPLMNAYVYVVPNDKYTKAEGGRYSIKGVPPGAYVLKAWHPRLSEKTYNVTVPAEGEVKVNVSL